MNEVIIYASPDNEAHVEVTLENETVWLSLNQMAELFERDKSVISRHLKSIFRDEELQPGSTVAKKATVQKEAGRDVKREIEYFNLDVIISLGYRVNSQRATNFRIWATKMLKENLVQGYSLNKKRLEQSEAKFKGLKNAVDLIMRTAHGKRKEDEGILKILHEYSHALELLDKYDHRKLQMPGKSHVPAKKLGYDLAISQIKIWREKQNAGNLFGNEKDDSFKSSINTIYQTFDGKELYPSLEEKAAHLLYFIVKNHSFSDGNKRIAAALFVYFLNLNGALFKSDGSKNIENNTLVALTLLIAESRPEEKEMMINVIVNLLY